MPAWPITVPQNLYDSIAEIGPSFGEPFADSYLWGAVLSGSQLIPRTVTAWERLSQSGAAGAVLKRLNVTLVQPAPWGSPGGSKRSHLEVGDPLPQRRSRRPDYSAW